jgi:hypothetical protein
VANHFSLVPGQKKAAQTTLPIRRGTGQAHNASDSFHPFGCLVLPDFQRSPAALNFGDFGF